MDDLEQKGASSCVRASRNFQRNFTPSRKLTHFIFAPTCFEPTTTSFNKNMVMGARIVGHLLEPSAAGTILFLNFEDYF